MQIVCKYMKPNVAIIHDTRRAKADEKYPVKVRITYNRKQKYYPTNIDLTETDWKKIHGERVAKELKDPKETVFGALSKAQNICDGLPVFNFTLFEKQFYTVRSNKKSLANLYEECIARLKSEGRIGTASSYQCSINSLQEFRPKINLEDITIDTLKQYEKWVLEADKSITTVGIYLRALRSLFNVAVKEGLISQEFYPFGRGKYEIPAGQNIKKALTKADVGKIYNYPTALGSNPDKAKDFWLFTYFCNGINMKDIALLKYKNIDGDFIRFIRAKTKYTTRKNSKPISIVLSDKAKTVIQKWGNKDKTPDNYIFPIISKEMSLEKQYTTIQQFIKNVNYNMGNIAKDLGIDKHVTTYTARHTFSTVLKHSGASTEFIGEALGHSNKKTTENYLDSFEQDTQKEFAKKLMDF